MEPTVEEVSYLPTEVNKGTELEVVFMKLKVFTLEYLNNKGKIKKETIKEINTKLSNDENTGDLLSANFYKEKIQQFEEEFIQKEWGKWKEFTLLEDEKPSKAFLNREEKNGI